MADLLSTLSAAQTARAALRIGNRSSLDAEVSVTPLGLLAIGGLVSAILLSVPPIISAAGRAARRKRRAEAELEAPGEAQASAALPPPRSRKKTRAG